MCPVSRLIGEGREDVSGRGGLGLQKWDRGWGGKGTFGVTQSVRGNCKSVKGINMTVLEGMHQFIMYILKVRKTSEERAECSRGWGQTGL